MLANVSIVRSLRDGLDLSGCESTVSGASPLSKLGEGSPSFPPVMSCKDDIENVSDGLRVRVRRRLNRTFDSPDPCTVSGSSSRMGWNVVLDLREGVAATRAGVVPDNGGGLEALGVGDPGVPFAADLK